MFTVENDTISSRSVINVVHYQYRMDMNKGATNKYIRHCR